MTAVAPPERSEVYRFGTTDNATSYVPGELLPMVLDVTARTILGKRDAGLTTTGNETAKYLGLLVYAVDRHERKVGAWEVALDESPRFWTPPDPGCGGQALMHSDAELKDFQERFIFQAPPNGTGPITFRVLVKQGETNKGAFYWASTVNTTSEPTLLQRPSRGVAGGDLVLSEVSQPSATGVQWIRAAGRAVSWPGVQSCTQVCNDAGMVCNDAALRAASSEVLLLPQIEREFLCVPPLLAGCLGAPRMSGVGDGFCWYRDPTCTETMPPCDELAPNEYDSNIRLCACSGGSPSRRVRHLAETPTLDGAAAEEAEQLRTASARAADCPVMRRAKGPHPSHPDGVPWGDSCPVMRAKAIAERGGLVSSTADAAYDATDAARARAASAAAQGARPLWMATGSYEVIDGMDGGGDAHMDGMGGGDAHMDGMDGGGDAHMDGMGGGGDAHMDGMGGGDAHMDAHVDADMASAEHTSWAAGAILLAAAALGMLTMLCVRRGGTRRKGAILGNGAARRKGASALLSLLPSTQLLQPTNAHNWMNGPKRGGGAGTTNPCARKTSPYPHVKVNRGQPFNIEWSSGHGGPILAVLVHARDEDQLKRNKPGNWRIPRT
jgi:hypothetical protein